MVLAATGGFLLWFGFFAFNGASVPDIVGTELVTTGRIAVVTTLSGATGAIFLLFFGYFKTKEWDMMLALNGLLAGMIASCSGVNAYEPWVSLIVGVTGSLAYLLQNHIFENVLHIDDPLGASPLHGAAGFLGMILVAIFGKPEFMGVEKELGGLLYGGDGTLLGWNLLGTVIDAVWGFGACGVIFVALNYFNAFRVSEEAEIMGMDIHHHGGHAYPDQHKLEELATTMHGTKFLSESDDDADEEQPQKQPLVERKSYSVLPDGAF
jgi:ammonium transporter, Amt family